MPDVIVIGGGIIGAATASALAERGATVTLLERDELAAGASGRNQGLWVLPDDPLTVPMARRSLATYLRVTEDAPFAVGFDREPVGVLFVAESEDQVPGATRAIGHYLEHGVRVDRLDERAIREIEPQLAPDLAAVWLRHEGHRLDPGALTVALGLRAQTKGAEVRTGESVRALVTREDRVTGVVTDGGIIDADEVVVAAGPWSNRLLSPIGAGLPTSGARGWLVRVRPKERLGGRLIEGGWRDPDHWVFQGEGPTVRTLLDHGVPAPSMAALLHPSWSGEVTIGSTRGFWLTPEPESSQVIWLLLEAAHRLVPSIKEAIVDSSWWGVRPLSRDGRPIVGRVRDGLVVATGHGSEGVINGAGTAELVAAVVLGEDPPFDPSPFDPARFGPARFGPARFG